MGKRASIVFNKPLPKEAKADLREFAEVIGERVMGGKKFVCLLSSDVHLRKLNSDFLGHDYATDVLSFPSGEPEELGEMAISMERASEQADEQGHTMIEEIKILMLHGALHLMGMDHEKDKGEMRAAETSWRKELGLGAGLIERARG